MHRTDDTMDEFRILQYSSVTTINWTKPQVSIIFWKMKLRRMEGLSFRMLIMQIFCLLENGKAFLSDMFFLAEKHKCDYTKIAGKRCSFSLTELKVLHGRKYLLP